MNANGRHPTLDTITGVLGDAGLDPLPDPTLATVAAQCPLGADHGHPGYYPLTVTLATTGELRIHCLAGCDEQKIRAAIPALANGTAPNAVRVALDETRVDLIDLIRNGMPTRQYVPGCHGRFAKGKRHHVAAENKSGKSIALGVVDALDVIEAGGTVAVLDRENGAEEYAQRLNDTLKARNADPELYDAVQQRFHYYAWPQAKLEWGKGATYPEAFAGVDLVIFDSSRTFLSSLGLEENVSDDYAKFATALIDPLMQAGIATLILDNTGHDEKGRPRGTSSKSDLADVVFSLKKLIDFDRIRTGRVELTCKRSRFGDVFGRWTMEIGGGVYDAWQRPEEDGREVLRQVAIASLLEQAPQGRDALIKDVREKGAKGRNEVLRGWLAELASDPASGIVKTTEGYVPEGWPQTRGQGRATPPSVPPLAPGPLPTGARGEGHPGPGPGPGHPDDDRFAGWQPYPTPSMPEDDEPPERKDLA